MNYKLDKNKVIILVIILIAIVSIIIFTIPKNCKTDETCFNTKASKCSKAKFIAENQLDIYKYEIIGKKKDTCLIDITLLEVSNTKPIEIKDALEGKGMRCAIPKEMLQTQNLKDINNINDYCTGQLKEAILQLTLDKMYDIIVKNIGSLATDFRNLLEEQ